MEPMYIEGLKTGFMKFAAYPGLSFHENNWFCLFFMRRIFSVVACVMMCLLLISLAYSLTVADNFSQFMEYFYGGSAHILIATRTIYFYIKRDQIRECLEILKPDFLKCKNYDLSKYQQIYNTAIKQCNTTSFFVTMLLYSSVVPWVLRPLLSYFYDIYFKSNDYMPGLYKILPNAYPFLINYSPVFEFIVILEMCLAILMVLEVRFHELTFLCIISMTCTQITILASSLRSITKHNEDNIRKKNSQQEAYQQMTVCVQDHRKIIRMTEIIQSTFSTLFDIQLGVSTALVVVAATAITKSTGVMDYMHGLVYIFTALVQLTIVCWKATKLIHASTDIGKAAYEADWINNSKILTPSIQMIVMRSHRPLRLTAMWGLITLDLETIVNVLRLSYSCFTMVKTLDSNN